jgi:hypothetical protein
MLKAFPLTPDVGDGVFDPDDLLEPNVEGPPNMRSPSPESGAVDGMSTESLPRLVIKLDLPTAVVNAESGLVELQKRPFNFGYRAKVCILQLNFV